MDDNNNTHNDNIKQDDSINNLGNAIESLENTMGDLENQVVENQVVEKQVVENQVIDNNQNYMIQEQAIREKYPPIEPISPRGRYPPIEPISPRGRYPPREPFSPWGRYPPEEPLSPYRRYPQSPPRRYPPGRHPPRRNPPGRNQIQDSFDFEGTPKSNNNSKSVETKKGNDIDDSKIKQKNISVLKNVKSLLCNICKNNAVFRVFNDYSIRFYNKLHEEDEYLIQINNIKINNKTSLYDIYIKILELYSEEYDFNISIVYCYKMYDRKNENIQSKFFGLIPIYDESNDSIVFYEDHQSISNFLKSITKVTDKKSIEIYTNLEKLCELKKKTHSMATKHYLCMNKYFLIPSVILSSSSGIASFLASSEYFKEYNLIFTISVGVASSITTLFQSFSNAFEFSTKAEAHQNAAESYDQLLTQIRFEKMSPNSNSETFINTIEKQILDTKQRCKYIVPEFIEAEYNEHKFNNYKEYVYKDLLKKFISLKSELYYNSLKDTNNFEQINFKEIEKKLAFDDIKDHDECCKSNETSPKSCCCL